RESGRGTPAAPLAPRDHGARGPLHDRDARTKARRLRRARAAEQAGGRSQVAGRGREGAWQWRRNAAGRRPAAARAQRWLRQAVGVYARAGLLQPDGLFDRSPRVGAGEGLHRLREVRALPPLRPVRHGHADRCAGGGRAAAAVRARARMSASSITGAPASTGGVATAKGFRAAGISAGIKATGKPDIALVVSDQPATAAAAFTLNKVQAAPILVCKEHLQKSGWLVRAIV